MLTVTKVVVNGPSGTKVVGDFPLFVDETPVTSGVANTFSIGAHTVSETTDPDYGATFTGDCAADGTITLVLGDVKTCTITNSELATIIIEKQTLPDGDPAAFTFSGGRLGHAQRRRYGDGVGGAGDLHLD